MCLFFIRLVYIPKQSKNECFLAYHKVGFSEPFPFFTSRSEFSYYATDTTLVFVYVFSLLDSRSKFLFMHSPYVEKILNFDFFSTAAGTTLQKDRDTKEKKIVSTPSLFWVLTNFEKNRCQHSLLCLGSTWICYLLIKHAKGVGKQSMYSLFHCACKDFFFIVLHFSNFSRVQLNAIRHLKTIKKYKEHRRVFTKTK